MDNIFSAIAKAEQLSQLADDLQGKSYGLSLAVVIDTQDPLALGRIKVLLPSKGAKTASDWLARMTPSVALSVPPVLLGDTVVVGFFDGMVSNGVYLGVLNNLVNLPQLAEETLVISPKAALKVTVGDVSISLDVQGNLDISGVSSVSINNKQVATVGARDTHGDTLVSKGW